MTTEVKPEILELASQALDLLKEHSPQVINNKVVQSIIDLVNYRVKMHMTLAEVAGTPNRFLAQTLLATEMLKLAEELEQFKLPEISL